MAQTEQLEPVTIQMVARRAGVSTATVSRVLQGTAPTSVEARSRVLRAVRELGYRVRTRPRTTVEHRAFGLLVPDLSYPTTELIIGMSTAAAELGWAVLPLVIDKADAASVARDLVGRVDGVAVAGGAVPDAVVQSLARSLPVVLVGRDPLPRCRSVTMMHRDASQALTSHLFAHGLTRLVFVGDADSSPEVSEQFRGFRLAHAAAGMSRRRPALPVPASEGAGRRVAEDLRRRRVPVDGLVCATDELALGVMAGLAENDVPVPQDVAVVGWGDSPAARLVTPGLTTVRLPQRRGGEMASVLLNAAASDGAEATGDVVMLPTELVLRGSCGCPGAGTQAAPNRPRRRRA